MDFTPRLKVTNNGELQKGRHFSICFTAILHYLPFIFFCVCPLHNVPDSNLHVVSKQTGIFCYVHDIEDLTQKDVINTRVENGLNEFYWATHLLRYILYKKM
jgi:hypothetical protein